MPNVKLHILAVATLFTLHASALALERGDLLPPETSLRIRIPNVEALITAVTNAPLAQMWKDKAFQDFAGNVDLREAFLESETKDMGNREAAELQLSELQMLKGEIVIGVAIQGEDDIRLNAVGHLSKDDYIKSLDMDRRISELSEDGSTFINHEFQGEQIVEMRQAIPDEDESDISFQAHIDETLLLSDDRDWVESCIVKLRGAKISEPAQETPGISVNVDGKQLMDFFQTMMDASLAQDEGADAAQTGAPKPVIGAIIPAMGLDQVGDLNVSLDLFNDRLEIASDMQLGNELKGILKMMDVRPVDAISPLPYPQDDLFMAMHSRIDLAGLWNEVPKIMGAISPGSEMMLGMMLMSLGGVDPGRDVFSHLDTTYSRVGRLRDGTPEELVLWRLNNPEALRQTLDGILAEGKPLRAQLDATMKVDNFRDHTVYTFPDETTGLRSGVAVAGDHLLMGSADMIRASIRALDTARERNPFMASPVYNRLLRMAPRNAFTVGIIDWERLVNNALKQDAAGTNPLAELMKQQQAAAAAQEDIPGIWSNINWDRFPPAHFFARYLGPSLSFSEAKAGKILSRLITYYPEDL